MSRATFEFICCELKPALARKDTVFRNAVPLEKRVAVALHLLKSTCDPATVADLYGIGESTAKKVLKEFCQAVNKLLRPKFLKPPTLDDLNNIVNGFEQLWDFPNCIGALDGSHIPILRPAECGTDYYNYKKYFSIVLMAVADHKYKFWYANVGQAGRNSDSTFFARTKLHERLSNGTLLGGNSWHLISDAAFPLKDWLLKPYLDNENTPAYQKEFNFRLSRARMVIKNAFGRLKGRWRILLRRMDNSVPVAIDIVNTCVILHNICETMDGFFVENWEDDDDIGSVPIFEQPLARPHNSGSTSAKEKLDHMARSFANE
ncbi:protein ANTAGONIST OF LIKE HETEROCHROMATIN PROTEIN 1 [Folsomia candida]|uniref:Putative nuclease HARBI1 n=1 Tax=Folsomia candida TaxID=158441 RepID=A0A226DU82_FOLCA|nr:protein ANTAGONIST OF LIKE HETEROCHROMATIN PROTEIN 1 [Folsomia candida]OXA48620.1 putative nuclease HARBI1 [Folsomia candida]